MKSFSQRQGLKPVRTLIQHESADEPLRNSLWNSLMHFYWSRVKGYLNENEDNLTNLLVEIWIKHYQMRIDEILVYTPNLINKIKEDFLYSSWNEMFDILEFIPNHYKEEGYDNRLNSKFVTHVNSVLEEHLSAYRLLNFILHHPCSTVFSPFL